MAGAWIKIYDASNNLEAHSIKGMLENACIEVHLSGESLGAAAGELPADVLQVGVWVHEEQKQVARELLQAYENRNCHDWVCPQCTERNEGQFEICWQCGHDKP
ncbi:DUF2007 domain-containing protein [Photobacterium sp. SDRW27]|uniref:putative signal transducing protein n=1 Tax=Photobacterium obscurum TaxID=2829490 RepID=UPI00224454E6|nr:DUF2007 domain-containing protein [Photobacterium obscurum]MCW8329519.1 DUF2007 domain-containing protein [Photobacterium obscurum]